MREVVVREEEGGRREEDGGGRARRRSKKTKNPTQQCGEKPDESGIARCIDASTCPIHQNQQAEEPQLPALPVSCKDRPRGSGSGSPTHHGWKD